MGGRVKIPNLTNNSPKALVFRVFMLAPFAAAIILCYARFLIVMFDTDWEFRSYFGAGPENPAAWRLMAEDLSIIAVSLLLAFGVGRKEPSPFRWLAYFPTFAVGFSFWTFTALYFFFFILGAIALQEMDFALNVLCGIAGSVPEVIAPLPAGWSG